MICSLDKTHHFLRELAKSIFRLMSINACVSAWSDAFARCSIRNSHLSYTGFSMFYPQIDVCILAFEQQMFIEICWNISHFWQGVVEVALDGMQKLMQLKQFEICFFVFSSIGIEG